MEDQGRVAFPLADLLHSLPEGRPLLFLKPDFPHAVGITGQRRKARMADAGRIAPELGGAEPRRFFRIIH